MILVIYLHHILGGNGTSIHSVSTLIITSDAGSNNDFVYKTISSAEALFIAGGDQYKYVTEWNNTKVQDAISILVKKGVPIGMILLCHSY